MPPPPSLPAIMLPALLVCLPLPWTDRPLGPGSPHACPPRPRRRGSRDSSTMQYRLLGLGSPHAHHAHHATIPWRRAARGVRRGGQRSLSFAHVLELCGDPAKALQVGRQARRQELKNVASLSRPLAHKPYSAPPGST